MNIHEKTARKCALTYGFWPTVRQCCPTVRHCMPACGWFNTCDYVLYSFFSESDCAINPSSYNASPIKQPRASFSDHTSQSMQDMCHQCKTWLMDTMYCTVFFQSRTVPSMQDMADGHYVLYSVDENGVFDFCIRFLSIFSYNFIYFILFL